MPIPNTTMDLTRVALHAKRSGKLSSPSLVEDGVSKLHCRLGGALEYRHIGLSARNRHYFVPTACTRRMSIRTCRGCGDSDVTADGVVEMKRADILGFF